MDSQVNAKTIESSTTEQIHIVMPQHLNGTGRLFGGQLALWIDEVAGVTARRHTGKAIVTAAIDNLRFREAVEQDELLIMRGKVTYVGTTSLEVRVDSYVEDYSGNRKLINTAFVIQVALGENGRPCKIPGLIFSTPMEEREFAAGEKRKVLRHTLNKELYD